MILRFSRHLPGYHRISPCEPQNIALSSADSRECRAHELVEVLIITLTLEVGVRPMTRFGVPPPAHIRVILPIDPVSRRGECLPVARRRRASASKLASAQHSRCAGDCSHSPKTRMSQRCHSVPALPDKYGIVWGCNCRRIHEFHHRLQPVDIFKVIGDLCVRVRR